MNPPKSLVRQRGYLGVAMRRALGPNAQTPDPTFWASLTTSIVLDRGSGSATFTRATTATIDDWEGVIRSALTGEVRFRGARRVQNLSSKSEDFSGWTAATPSGSTSGSTITFTGSGNDFRYDNVAVIVGHVYNFTVRLQAGTKTGTIVLRDASQGVQATISLAGLSSTSDKVFSFQWTANATATHNIGFDNRVAQGGDGIAGTIICTGAMVEDVTGQSNQNPAEYVSVGVKSAPYHGANVDGVKYFTTQNGNAVASNVVTEATGAAISSSTALGYLSEEARTNLCLQSQDSETTWTKGTSLTTSSNSTVAPDGTTTADTLTDANASGVCLLTQNITVTADTTRYVFSTHIKKTSGATVFAALNFQIAGGTTVAYGLVINTDAGTIVNNALGSGAGITSGISAVGPYWRVWVSGANNGSALNTALQVQLSPAWNTDGSTGSMVSAQGSNVFWGHQLEAGSFPTSYIPTTTASVTRNKDVLSFASAGNLVALNPYTLYAEAQIEGSIGNNQNLIGSDVSFNAYFLLQPQTPGAAFFNNTSDKAATESYSISNMETLTKYAARFDGANLDVFVAGTKGTTATKGTQTSEISTIYIGAHAGGNELNGTIRNVKIWQSALSDAQIKVL